MHCHKEACDIRDTVRTGTWGGRVRTLSDIEIETLYYSARNYVQLKDRYLSELA